MAVLHYVARKGNLLGDSDQDFATSEILIAEFSDLFDMMAKANYAPDKEAAYTALFAVDGPMRAQFAHLERLVLDNNSFTSRHLAGDYAIACGINLAVTLDSSVLDSFPKLRAFYEQIIATPAFDGVKDYQAYFQRGVAK
jgi:hypothetical protein